MEHRTEINAEFTRTSFEEFPRRKIKEIRQTLFHIFFIGSSLLCIPEVNVINLITS